MKTTKKKKITKKALNGKTLIKIVIAVASVIIVVEL